MIIAKVSKSRPSTKPGNWSYLMYEDTPRYDRITKILIAAILGTFLVAGIGLLFLPDLTRLSKQIKPSQ